MARGRVVLAMSGGVDSSVCARLLQEQGYDVVGLFMRTGAVEPELVQIGRRNDGAHRGCCSAVDAADARRVADRLEIPFYALNFEDDFRRIKDYFADEYLAGRTPNPCVVCNTWLKFGKLWDYARAIGADWIATGHYARIVAGDDGPQLCRGVDPDKDQSYFLFGLERSLLDRVIFPVGGLNKSEVRELAQRYDLGVHTKPDSQEICFVPTGDYQGFVRSHRADQTETQGPIVDTEGKVLGTHSGISGFTIGQRKGLGVAVGVPRYVVELDAANARVVVGAREHLLRTTLRISGTNWLREVRPGTRFDCHAKIRYLHEAAAATVVIHDDDSAEVEFAQPQSAITPGQAVVVYDRDRVLGGGWIDSDSATNPALAP